MKLVSVIVRSTNRIFLDEAIQSIQNQSYRNIEIIIVDASGTGEIGAREFNTARNINIVCTGEPLIRPKAANAGLLAAKGDELIFLDDDDVFYEHHIAKLIEARYRSPDNLAAYSDVEVVGTDLERLFTYNHEWSKSKLFLANYIPVNSVLFSSKVLDFGCIFDENLPILEDWDWWLQVANYTSFTHVKGTSACYRYGLGESDHSRLYKNWRFVLYKKWIDIIGVDGFIDNSFEWAQQADSIQKERSFLVDEAKQRDTYIDTLHLQIASLEADLDSIQKERSFLVDEARQRDTYIDTLHLQIASLEADLDSIRQSRSWRLTIPLRNAGRVVRLVPRIAGLIRNNPDLWKRFAREMRRNGVKHAVEKAMAAAQRHSAMPTTATKGAADLWKLFSQSPNIPQLDADMVIDIIIPVYNGQEYLQPLFSSIISNTMLPYRLLVADDKSTDADILPLLYALKSKNPDVDITIVENSENLGFVKTVNKLAQLAHGNFVLLNTDVEVPPHWLERLIYPLVTMDGVASATPFTNSGTICSFPNYLQDNDLPNGMDVRSVDRAFSFVKFSNNILDIPTGVGFCMAINKAVWDKIGGFDEVFGKGYGEENDWCMRASKFGYRNLHIPNLFVYHKHGGSFLTEDKERYLRNNLAIINERHPDYSDKVQQLIENDAFSFLRKCVLAKALCDKYGSIAIFDHDLGGGANQYVAESINSNHKVSIIIRYNTIRREFEASFRGDNISDLTIKADTLPDIRDLVSFFNVDELVINNIVSYPKVIDFIEFLCGLTDRRMRMTYMMHDFYAVCPMYNLINYEMEYCGVPEDLDYCNKCLKSNPLIREQVSYIRSEYPNLSISDWRTHFGRLLDIADKIVFFSQSSLAIASKAHPELSLHPDKLEVKPHKVTWVRQVATVAPGDIINIGIIGVMTFTKGIHIISALAGYIDSCQLNYRVHVFGDVADPQISLEQHQCVTLHGRYERDELPLLMEQARIDIILIPSIWPETFSYTTEESILMDLPVAVFDIGAPSERVRQYAKGIILRDKSPRAIFKSIDEYFDRSPIVQIDAEQEQEDEIVFVCVSNNEHMYQRCVGASSFMTHHRIIKYNNCEDNVPIPTRYNSAISELLDAGYHGWIFFIHNDFSIMENILQIVKPLNKEAVYGPIGAILDDGIKKIHGEILQGHEGSLIPHGKKIDRPTPVDTVDCQCVFFHSDTARKYPLRFDEAAPLDFHQYAEEFCLAAKTQAGLQTYAVQIKCKHLSWGMIDESFDRAIKYINNKHRTIMWAGTCTHLDKA